MMQQLKSPHFFARVILVTLISFEEIDSTFSLSLNTDHSEFVEHMHDYTPIEFNEYNTDELQLRDKKLYNFAANLNDDDFNDDLIRLKRVVSDCV